MIPGKPKVLGGMVIYGEWRKTDGQRYSYLNFISENEEPRGQEKKVPRLLTEGNCEVRQ